VLANVFISLLKLHRRNISEGKYRAFTSLFFREHAVIFLCLYKFVLRDSFINVSQMAVHKRRNETPANNVF